MSDPKSILIAKSTGAIFNGTNHTGFGFFAHSCLFVNLQSSFHIFISQGMGYIKHHAVVVTGKMNQVIRAHEKATAIFKDHFRAEEITGAPVGSSIVSEVLYSLANMYCSFLIAPDGSKLGFDTSNLCYEARKEFLDWLDRPENYCDYAEITFGGDDDLAKVIRNNR